MRTRRSRSPRASSKKSTVFIPRPSRWCFRTAIESTAAESRLLNDTDGPEIVGQVAIGQVSVGNGEVSTHAPIGAPGVAHQEARRRVVVSSGHDGMSAQYGFGIRGHGDDA